MNEMNSFAYPWALLLYIPFVLAVIYALRKPEPSLRVSDLKLYNATERRSLFSFLKIPLYLYVIALGLLILALARPRKGRETIKQRAEGIDIMLAIDLSGSMKSIDVPYNIRTEQELNQALVDGKLKERLEVAKEEITKFIENRPNDRIGLISFAPLPFVACPPTLDHSYLIGNLKYLKPGMIGDRTGIAGPVASAVHRLRKTDSKRKVVVLFTDGSNNVDAKITPRQAAQLAKEYNVIIYTVGIGSRRAYIKQRGMFGEEFFPVESQFDEELLKDLAKITEGRYYRAKDAEGLRKAMKQIGKLEKTSVEQPRYINYTEWAPRIIWIAVLVLISAFFLEHTFFLKIP